MKPRLLKYLCCPMCQGDLRLIVLREESEIEEGMLTGCACGRTYPIIGGIPRMLPDSLVAQVVHYHPEFFHRYPDETAGYRARSSREAQDRWWKAERRTLTSYSYQWRKFK